MAITKNKQSNEKILEMTKAAFPSKKVTNITELTEGMCNVAYDISFDDGSESILKISSANRTGNISNEINLMSAEVQAMELVRRNCTFKVADVQYYDTTHKLCDGDYFFMEKLQGKNYCYIKYSLSENDVAKINEEIGIFSKQLTKIRNNEFGFLGDTERYSSLFDFTKIMLTNLIKDAGQRNIDIVYDADSYMKQLENDRTAFEGISSATLVHWDLWDGNVFVDNGHVAGIIDWERALWGEAFMDDRFRHHNREKCFLAGFGKTSFSENELKRIKWYDIILYLTMMIEVFYREYEDKGQYLWAKDMLMEVWEKVSEVK